MRRTGEVTQIKGNMLEVTFCRPSDCEKCHACHGGAKQTSLMVKGQANIGDRVVVEIPTRTVMKASVLAYGLPLVGLFLGMILAGVLFPESGDTGALLGAVIGLTLPLLGIVITEKIRASSPQWQPRLIEVLPPNN
ncbi:MAG: hypothetical protein E7333_02215 [Clostridiales bacterium]|nr:hypothetical protein [Clostridiales bacterium]